MFTSTCDQPKLKIWVARSFVQRAVGLLGRRRLAPTEAMYFPNTRSVHTIGMLFAIDVIYLDERLKIVAIRSEMKPFRFSACSAASSTCELAAGVASQLGLKIGQIWPWMSMSKGDKDATSK